MTNVVDVAGGKVSTQISTGALQVAPPKSATGLALANGLPLIYSATEIICISDTAYLPLKLFAYHDSYSVEQYHFHPRTKVKGKKTSDNY